jgi:hypothetical protein
MKDASKVVDVDRFQGNLIVYFDDGKHALYSASLLRSVLRQAIQLEGLEETDDWNGLSAQRNP